MDSNLGFNMDQSSSLFLSKLFLCVIGKNLIPPKNLEKTEGGIQTCIIGKKNMKLNFENGQINIYIT